MVAIMPKLIDPENKYMFLSENELKEIWLNFYPAGSGPLAIMRELCRTIEALARLRGFDVNKWQ